VWFTGQGIDQEEGYVMGKGGRKEMDAVNDNFLPFCSCVYCTSAFFSIFNIPAAHNR
jgi:hypothetical protein